MADKMKGAGFRPRERPSKPEPPPVFPPGYPDYFDTNGVTKAEYVTVLAESLAHRMCNAYPELTTHQLRSFYQYVKQREAALNHGRPLDQVKFELKKLKAFAEEREAKEKIPKVFRDFIDRNVDRVEDRKSIVDGFVEHFQAVVAYCAGPLRRREGRR